MSSILTRPSSKISPAAPLCRRILFPHLPPSLPTPPLFPDASQDLNAELYDFLALALRAYITPWWSKLTRYDKEFVPHAATVITTVIRALAARALDTDLAPLVFRDLPTLVAQHCTDYRAAAAKLGTSYALGGAASLAQLFHQLQPHMAIDAQGNIDAVYVRHAIDHVLNSCLPPEDYEPDAERAIIREVIVKVILTDVMPRLVQPWFIHKIIFDLLGPSPAKPSPPEPPDVPPRFRHGPPSFHSIVVFFLSTIQTISGLALTLISLYKQTIHTVKVVNNTSVPASLSVRLTRNYAPCILDTISEVLTMRERAASNALINCAELITGVFGAFFDRLLPYLLEKHVLTQARIAMIVKLSSATLFPNGYPGPPPIDPTPEEQATLKEQLIDRIEERIPPFISSVMLGPATASTDNPHTRRRTILAALAPLSSPQCNAHLILFLLDLILVTMFPEMGVGGGSGGGGGEMDSGVISATNSHSTHATEGDDAEDDFTPPGSRLP